MNEPSASREAFEKARKKMNTYCAGTWHDDHYADSLTQDCWELWQAAIRDSNAMPDEKDFIERVRVAIYNTWHKDGIANVKGVAIIAVKSLRSFLKASDSNAELIMALEDVRRGCKVYPFTVDEALARHSSRMGGNVTDAVGE